MTTTTTTALNLQRHLLRAALLVLCCSAVSLACHGKLLVSGITEAEKTVILQEHNKLRQMVATGRYPGQPAAENMREIVWDDELAARAQKWADNCQFRHDPHRTINRFTMGQNLAIIWSTAPLDPDDGDFPSRIQSWFNEVQKYSFGDAWSPKTGHYSQLVWGETSLVGCGFAEYKDTTKYNKLYVCNYGPGGNVVGYNPYEVGKPSCATYGLRPSSRYPGLCAAPGASANSISSNTIDTYEYTQSNAFNNQQNAYGTQYLQQASSSYPQQASPPRAQPTPAAPAPAPAPAAAAPAAPASAGGSSYGSKGYGGSVAFTTEASQYGGSGGSRYKNKLEAYKPSPAEFEKSVRKHTILRTYLNQGQGQGQGQGLGQAETPRPEAPTATTPKPAKRGWSLLTWRG